MAIFICAARFVETRLLLTIPIASQRSLDRFHGDPAATARHRHHIDKLSHGVKQDVIAKDVQCYPPPSGRYGAIIGTKLNDRQTERTRRIGSFQCHITNLATKVRFIKTACIDTANKTKRIARCFKIDRALSGLNEHTVMIGFVVIMIK